MSNHQKKQIKKSEPKLFNIGEIKKVKWLKPKALFLKSGMIVIFVTIFSLLTLLEDTGFSWTIINLFNQP